MANKTINFILNLIPDTSKIKEIKEALKQAGQDVNIIDSEKITKEFEKVERQAKRVAEEAKKINPAENIAAISQKYNELKAKYNENIKYLQSINQLTKLGGTLTEEQAQKYNTVTNEIKEQKRELGQLKNQLKDVDNAFVPLGQKGNLLNRAFAFNQIAQGMQLVGDAVTQIGQPFVGLDTATQSMKTLGKEAEAMAPRLREAAIVMSKDLPFGAAEFQQAMTDAIASGVKGGEEGLKKFAETSAKLAIGGGAELADVGKGLAATMNAYGDSSEKAAQYSDYMFNVVNYGVTSIQELNQYLSQVTPTAAAAGVEFENVGGALALMTQKGVPTAQAASKLNAMMIELIKPSSSLGPILKQAGVSLESLKKDDLPVTLAKISDALKKTGMTASQAFSSSEAGAAFNVLMGTAGEFQQTFEDVRDTAGSTENAYTKMSDSIEVRTKQAKAVMDSFVISAIDGMGGFGTALVTASQSLGQIQGPIIALAGIKQIFPENMAGRVGEFSKSLIAKYVPAAVSTDVATKATTVSFKAFSKAILTNPVFLIITGAIAAVAALKLLSDALKESAEERIEQAEAQKKVLKSEIDHVNEQRKSIKENQKLITSYRELGDQSEKNTASQEQVNQAMEKVASKYPKLIDGNKTYAENMKALEDQSKKNINELKNLDTQFAQLKSKEIKLEVELSKLNVEKSAEDIETTLTDQLISMDLTDWGDAIATSVAAPFGGSFLEQARQGLQEEKTGFEKMGDNIAEWLGFDSGARVEARNVMKPYIDAIKNAKNDGELQKASHDFKMAIYDEKFGELPPETKSKLIENATTLVKNQADAMAKEQEARKDEFTIWLTEFTSKGDSVETAIEKISKKMKISKEEANKILKELEKNKETTGSWAGELEKVAEKFADVKKASQEGFDTKYQAVLDARLEKEKALASGDKVAITNAQNKLKLARASALEADKELDNLVKIEKEEKSLYEDKAKKAKSILDSYNKQYDLAIKNLAIELNIQNINAETLILEQDREKNTEDEINAQERVLLNLYRQRDAFQSIYNVKLPDVSLQLSDPQNFKDEITKAVGTIPLSKAEIDSGARDKLTQQIQDLFLNINEGVNKDVEVTLKSKRDKAKETKELEEMKADLAQAQLEYDIEIGIKNPDAMLPLLESQLESVISQLGNTETKLTEKELLELQDKELKIRKSIHDVKISLLDEEAEKLQEKYDREEAILNKRIDLEKNIIDVIIAGQTKIFENKASENQKNEQAALEALKEKSLVSEEEYNLRKTKIDERYTKQNQVIQDIARGQQLVAENELTIALLEKQRQRKEEELKIATEAGDIRKMSELTKAIGGIEGELSEKKDALLQIGTQLQTGLTDTFNNLFSGDPEAMRAPFRQMFSVIGGALKQMAAATVADMVLKWLNIDPSAAALPIWAKLGAIPIIRGLSQGAVNAILGPLLNSLASFSTGGRVDSKSLVWVGDASESRPGSDTEWIARDIDIKRLTKEVLKDFSAHLDEALFDMFDVSLDRFAERSGMAELSKDMQSLSLLMSNFDEFKRVNKQFQDDMIEESELLRLLQEQELSIRTVTKQSSTPSTLFGRSTLSRSQIDYDNAVIGQVIADQFYSVGANIVQSLSNKIDELILVVAKKKFLSAGEERELTEIINRTNASLNARRRS